MLVDPSYASYTAVWACPTPAVPAWEMWGTESCLQAVPPQAHAVPSMYAGQAMAAGHVATHMWGVPSTHALPELTSGRSDSCPFDAEEIARRQADVDECLAELPGHPADTEQELLSADILAARVEQDACAAKDVEQQSVAMSSCSTAPSIVAQKRRKPRPPPAQRKADAARHREAERLAQELLKRGNDLSAHLKAGGRAASAAVVEVSGVAWRLSLDSAGCRIVQDAIKAATGVARAEVVRDLHGHVREGMGSPHANYVLQRVVEVMPIDIASFVAEELAGITADACRHRYGCRIMCRLIEQFARSPCVTKLMEEMMKDVAELARHTFGKHVMQAVLEHGANKHRHTIAMELAEDILTNATNRNGSCVIERALLHCESQDVSLLMRLLTDDDVLANLIMDQFGIFIVKTLLQVAPRSLVERILEKVDTPPEGAHDNKHFQKLSEHLQQDADECAWSVDGEDNS